MDYLYKLFSDGMISNLYLMRVFIEVQVSTNIFFRITGNAIDMRQIMIKNITNDDD